MRQVAVPAPGADPIVLVPRNPRRTAVSLLNESANPVRITGADLALAGGALLPASMTSYKDFRTREQICAYQPAGNTGVANISVIDEYDVPGAS